jgi:hypothetical protein
VTTPEIPKQVRDDKGTASLTYTLSQMERARVKEKPDINSIFNPHPDPLPPRERGFRRM